MNLQTLRLALACTLPALITAESWAEAHYLDRYQPAVIYTFDQPIDAERFSDTKDQFEGAIHFQKDETRPPTLIEGARPFLGNAWDFSGRASCFTSKTGPTTFTLGDIEKTSGMSASFWMKSVYEGNDGNSRIMGYAGFDITVNKGRGEGSLRLFMGEYSAYIDYKAGAKLFDGNWHHVATTTDFTTKTDNVSIYIDGELVTRSSGFANKSFNSTNAGHSIVLGARSNKSYFFNGALDDVALFDYTLSDRQVAEIAAGPVYAGSDEIVYLPDNLETKAVAPDGTATVWSLETGSGEVVFSNANQTQTQVSFSAPGDYTLNYSVAGFPAQQLKVTALPPALPIVSAGDPRQINQVNTGIEFSGTVSVAGLTNLDAVQLKWQKVSGPGDVTFDQPNALKSTASFSQKGLYRLRLKATASGLSASDDTTVYYSDSEPSEGWHYASVLDPLYIIAMDHPANRDTSGVQESAGGTSAELVKADDILPQMVPGARAFTGLGWDFAKSDAAISAHNRFNVAQQGKVSETDGVSLSFWLKGEDYIRDFGRIGGIAYGKIDFSTQHFSSDSAGLTAQIDGVTIRSRTSGESRNLFDGSWHHAVLSADYSISQDNVHLYIDGEQVNTVSHAFTNDFNDIRTDHANYWAARPNGGSQPFKGQLDDIVAFNRPLTNEEVTYLYAGPSTANSTRPLDVMIDENHIYTLPEKSITLKASLTDPGQDKVSIQYQWKLIKGPGPVTLATPANGQTEVTFEPLADTHNPDYRHYLFRVTAMKADSTIHRHGHAETSVVFYKEHTPKTRTLSATPAPGVHPRILFAPEDVPEMRLRVQNDRYAPKAIELMKSRYNKTLFDPNNSMGYIYKQLLDGNEDVSVNLVVGDGVSDVYNYTDGQGQFYGNLCGAAFLTLIEDDSEKALELATVVSNCATAQLKYYRPAYGSYLAHDASGALGLTYDFLYNTMTPEQRVPVRQLLSKMTQWRQTMGTGMITPDNSSNWRTFHDHILIASLAIEGEEGYDPEVYTQTLNKLREFFTQYGVFRSGYAHEGWGYFSFGMTSASLSTLAVARRDENLYETTNLYNSMLATFRSMPPGQDWAASHGDTMQGQLHTPPNQLWVARYLWPENEAIAYAAQTLADKLLAAEDQRKLSMMPIMFAVGNETKKQSLHAIGERMDLPLTLFCPDKGYINTRSDWTDDALLLTFRSRMDKYFLGHMHPDVNSFELYAGGHEWFTDPGKYGIPNDMHQTVLIDGIGGGGSSAVWTWPSLPGTLVEFTDTPEVTFACGDAKAFYDYVIHEPKSGTQIKDFTTQATTEHGLTWDQFVYPQRDASTPLPKWRNMPLGNSGKLWEYNPMQRAFRSALLVRGQQPYALIVDDYQKDDAKHDYQWVGNLRAGTIETVSSNETDLILKQNAPPDDGARLLVRVLNANGQQGSPTLLNSKIQTSPTSHAMGTQVLIDSKQVLSPDFKVMLFPFTDGDPLPSTTWKDGQLHIQFSKQADILSFDSSEEGRTQVTVQRDGKIISTNQ